MNWKAKYSELLDANTIDDAETGEMICTLDCEGWSKEKRQYLAALIESAPLLKEIIEDMLRTDVAEEHKKETLVAAQHIINHINNYHGNTTN